MMILVSKTTFMMSYTIAYMICLSSQILLEFRLYRNGEHVETVLCGRPVVLNNLGMASPMRTVGI